MAYEAFPLSGGRTAYMDMCREVVFIHDPRNEQGFGGRMLELKLTDGSTAIIKGPWELNRNIIPAMVAEGSKTSYPAITPEGAYETSAAGD